MESTIHGWRGILVHVGLGHPASRAFVVATAIGIAAYALKVPQGSFDEDGHMRPFKLVSKAPTATATHFLAVPVVAAALTYTFT